MTLPSAYEIKQMRLKAGLTQETLAKKAGVSQGMVARIENGDVDPRASTLNKILSAIESTSAEAKKAKDVMISPVKSIPAGSMISEAIELMKENAISQLPVVKIGVPVGMLTEQDITREIEKQSDPSNLKRVAVDKIMRESPPIVSKNADLRSVLPLLEFNTAVFVMEKTKLIGIISRSDILDLI